MAGGVIASAIIGIAGTVASTAAQIAQSSVQNATSNLAVSIEILNGTEYVLVPRWSGFRKGAAGGGTEGEWLRTPRPIDPRDIGVISATQIKGAGTDVIGCVVYQCDVFDFWVGFHVYDQFGIQRYIFAGLYPKDHLSLKALDNWNADLRTENPWTWPNKYIWSGAGPYGSKFSSKGTTKGTALKVKGKFRRGEVQKKADGTFDRNEKGEPILHHVEAESDGSKIEFSAQASGGAAEMSAVVFDEDTLYAGEPDDTTLVRSTTV